MKIFTLLLFNFLTCLCFSQTPPIFSLINSPDWNKGGNLGSPTTPNVIGPTWSSAFYFRTGSDLRMKLNGPISYPINGYNRDRQGFLLLTNNPDAIAYENSIGQNPMNQSNYGAFSLLHLIGDESNNVQTDGYRSWMRNGLLFSNNFDAGFIGVRKMNLTTGDDVSDFVINWNDNYGTSPGTGTPDNLIFSFTSGEDSLDVNHLTGRSYYGREVMRLTTNGNIGMGPEFNNNNQPKVELHIHTEDSTESYLQFSDELTGSSYTDGFRMGIPSTTSTNMPGIINQQENDRISIQTNKLERIRISHTGALNNGINSNPYGFIANLTRVGISHNPFVPLTQPRSLLHLGYNTASTGANSNDGHRSWMDVGMYISQSSNNLYIGQRYLTSQKSESIISFGDSPSNNINNGTVLRFTFTSPLVNNSQTISETLSGLELIQLWADGNNGRVGIGNFQTTGSSPLNTLEIFASTTSPYFGSINGSSGLKFRLLNSSNTPLSNPGNGVLSVDANGNVIYVNSSSSTLGNYCGNSSNPLINDYQITMNNKNIYFPGQNPSNFKNRLGAGYNCNEYLRARINAYETGLGCMAGFFDANEINAPGFNNYSPTGVFSIARGNGNNYSGFTGVKGYASGTNAVYNYAICGIIDTTNTTSIQRAGYFNGDVEIVGGTVLSDQIFKTEITDITSALETLNHLQPKSYYFDTITHPEFVFSGKKQYGFIAQDVETILPELVNQSVNPGLIDSTGEYISQPVFYKSLNYNAIIPITAKAVQELDTKVERQTLSDASLKTNVSNLQNALGIISSLRGVSYFWTQTNPNYSFDTTEHIGFIAQEVDTVDSRLTYMDSDSLLHVDYNKVVPILTEAIQELATINSSQDSIINSLNDRLTLLENCINNLNLCNGETFSMNQTNPKPINNSMKVELSNSSTIVLNQNVPNPFAEQTTITMELPLEIKIAQILFHNNEGRLIQSVEIQDRGFSELTVYANDLSTGVYTYTLVTDGKIIASKKMIRQ
jgi:hypothetical protein